MPSIFKTGKPDVIYILIALAVLLNFSSLTLTIIGPDGDRYASIAKTMVQQNNFIELFSDGGDWLDKPHFPFWITALSFKCFGINTWAYKLPGILFLMLGACYTYLLAKELYNKTVGLWSVLILLTAEHIILSSNDVRAEPYLTGLIIASIFHFYKAYKVKDNKALVLGSLFAGCAIMTKGVFAIVPIGSALVAEMIRQKDWKQLFHIRWLVAGGLTFLFILPELYCLYYQFDLHPEKVVFGRTGVSGVWFFFIGSQFGRFFNNGPIKGAGNPLFYFHTLLWAFLPWSVLLYISVIQFFKSRNSKFQRTEWLCIGGSLATFVLFSLSKFQLPYYLNIVFPFFAILTAQYIYKLNSLIALKRIAIMQTIIISLLFIVCLLLSFFYKPGTISLPTSAGLFVLFTATLFVSRSATLSSKEKIIYKTALAALFLNFYLVAVFYPSLLQYQSGSEGAFWINRNNKAGVPVATMRNSYPLLFYLKQTLYPLDTSSINTFPFHKFLLYVPDAELQQLKSKGFQLQVLKQFYDYPISRLNLRFINAATRTGVLEKMDIAYVQK